jgi:hypothetical protein
VTPDIRFLIIGAPKAGTTSLFEYMRTHPQIHMPAEKEVYFFNIDRNYRRGLDWYAATMTRGASERALVCGEATTEYMSGAPYVDDAQQAGPQATHISHNGAAREEPEAGGARGEGEAIGDGKAIEEVIPRRIRQALPDVKLICVLRDPVERAYSHYRMMALDRVESRSFEDVVDQLTGPVELERTRVVRSRDNGYVVNGEYARLLGGFLNVFPREQLMAIFTDELTSSPRQTLASVFDFVGVSSEFVPDNAGTRYRAAAVKQRIPGLNLINWQTGLARVKPARALWHSLPGRVRGTIDHRYNVANLRVEMWNAYRGEATEEMPPSVRERLIAHFRPDSEALAELLGERIPWLASWDAHPA